MTALRTGTGRDTHDPERKERKEGEAEAGPARPDSAGRENEGAAQCL